MKNSILSIAFICLSSLAFAQIDTMYSKFDFNNLNLGNLNNQDSWITTQYGAVMHDDSVTNIGSFNGTKAVKFNWSGPSYGTSASRKLDTLYGGSKFTDLAAEYDITFDIQPCYWGLDFGLAADLNADGKTAKAFSYEHGIRYTCGTLNGQLITLPNGVQYTLAGANANWRRVFMHISGMNQPGGGLINVYSKNLVTNVYDTLCWQATMGIDSSVITLKNPKLWNLLYFHIEGATGYLDDINFQRIGNHVNTGIEQLNQESFQLGYDANTSTLHFYNISFEKSNLMIWDLSGRKVYETEITKESTVNISSLNSGSYIININDGKKSIVKKWVKP